MSLDTNDYQEIRQLFDDYQRMYGARDDQLTTLFSENFSGFTGGGDHLVKDREEWVAITRKDFAQVKDPLRIELKDLAIQSLSDTIAVVTAFSTLHLPIEEHILSRTVARLVLIFRKESSGWKICHSSVSLPDGMARAGEVYPLQELTERNQLLEEQIAQRTLQLTEAKKAAEAANSAKNQFLATVSHEIRTPLNALVGFSSMVRTTTDPVKLKQYHAILEQSSRSLMDLVNDILDMSKIEAGRMELEAVPFNLRQLAAGLEEQYRPLAEQKNLAFRVVMADELPEWVLGDPVRLRQILANLLANAVKFTNSGEVGFIVDSSDRTVAAGDPLVRFEVRDTGIGIPEAARAHLFQPFRQLDPTITRKFGGSGLGLAIVHSLVEMMRGRITMNSRHGAGSSFLVELPLPDVEPLSDEPAHPVNLALGSVLAIEDNEFNRRLLGDILTAWGQQVVLAENGWQGLQFLEQRPFDLVLLDIRMPDMDGMEVARRIRRREQEGGQPPIPIIAITADVEAATFEACVDAGINAVLPKPIIPEQLAKAIYEQCGGTIAAATGGEMLLSRQTRSDLNNSPERARQYREMLLADINDELECMQTALEGDDRNGLGRAAHTLKGLCGHLANPKPAELASWLQHLAPSASPEQLRQVMEQLRTGLAKECAP
ncbi:ATP-binding protein [Geomesophilobacter sediminis]|uniref:histidine kinase n=1 Tax=Geomesophilobacter sediminis TaxID=2798584 RepID=A0A8J7JJT6_9BACT|nr:ATP-binding protein [Geomesophilobacter sediminis]MBJ6723245.1 response regulator [Geomesophilobacter sediminis]